MRKWSSEFSLVNNNKIVGQGGGGGGAGGKRRGRGEGWRDTKTSETVKLTHKIEEQKKRTDWLKEANNQEQ